MNEPTTDSSTPSSDLESVDFDNRLRLEHLAHFLDWLFCQGWSIGEAPQYENAPGKSIDFLEIVRLYAVKLYATKEVPEWKLRDVTNTLQGRTLAAQDIANRLKRVRAWIEDEIAKDPSKRVIDYDAMPF